MNQILNVTDLSSYLYCPRKFFLERIKGIRGPPTQPMIEGSIRHKVREHFANNEEKLFQNLELINQTLTKQKVVWIYQDFLEKIISNVFEENSGLIYKFNINYNQLKDKILESMKNEILLRSESVENTIKKGFTGSKLWQNLTPKYISEMPIFSEKLNLKGRVDRVMFTEDEKTIEKTREIVPFELKTRTADKVWPSDEIQVTAYAMLLEEKYNQPISTGILEAGNINHEIKITPENKQKVLDLIAEIQTLYKDNNPKFPNNFSKCQKCSSQEDCEKIEDQP